MALLIKEIVPHIFEKRSGWHTTLLSQWDSIVGSLTTRVRLEKIQGTTLTIGVYESHWMQELYLLSPLLLSSINQCLDEPHIKQLRFKLVEEKKRVQRKMGAMPVIMRPRIPLSAAQEQALSKISDEQLKESLIQFWSHCQERELKA